MKKIIIDKGVELEMTDEQQRYRIIKIRNGCWKLEWEDGSYSTHSLQEGALRMAAQITSKFK